jgi:hypothetical protein
MTGTNLNEINAGDVAERLKTAASYIYTRVYQQRSCEMRGKVVRNNLYYSEKVVVKHWEQVQSRFQRIRQLVV